MDHPFKSPAVLSLCPGMLGLERGLERVIGRVRSLAYVEIEAFVIENLVRQMEQGVLAPTPVWSNVKTFPFESFYGKVHWITGGYPCQPFSHAGNRKGDTDPRHLWPYIKSGIAKSRPMGLWFENVEGHISLGLRDVLADIRKLGYQAEVGIFSAAEVGAPHRRNRIFILGMENSIVKRVRGWYDEATEWQREIQTERSGELGNTNNGGFSESRVCQEQSRRTEVECSSKMAHTNTIGPYGSRALYSRRDESTHGSELANSVGQRLEGTKEQSARKEFEAFERSGGDQQWPARPGQPQFEWEAPRVESSLGYTINGYNFREDLLRMAGNAVVEQTAELAFRTLIKKFI